MLPDLSFEQKLWGGGFTLVIGVDEVGRGSLAGPVVAGAAAIKLPGLPKSPYGIDFRSILTLGINDSKKLSEKKRMEVAEGIKKHFYWAIGEASVGFINAYGIRPATERAMRSAVVSLLYKVLDRDDTLTSKTALSATAIIEMKPYVLLDAFQVKYLPVVGLAHQQAIVRGDQKSISIAAASVVAKVYRDDLMKKLHLEFPRFGWDANSGYGTKTHIMAIREFGGCRHHRTKFIDGVK